MNARFLFSLLSCYALIFSGSAQAGGPVVAEGLGISIDADDLSADAQRVPAHARKQALSKPELVQQAASNLFVRRALAAEAERDGLANDPQVAAALKLARDRVLSDARLAKIDTANKPTEEAVEKAARAAYAATPEKFRTREQTRARHILIAGNTDKAKAIAEKVLADVKAGADFAKLASELSADTATGVRGGDLGYFEFGAMLPEFDDAVTLLKTPGEVSGLVQTQYGWHIIKLEGRRPAGQRTYEEVKEDLQQMVSNQLQSDVRLREASRLAGSVKYNSQAIEAFSAAARK